MDGESYARDYADRGRATGSAMNAVPVKERVNLTTLFKMMEELRSGLDEALEQARQQAHTVDGSPPVPSETTAGDRDEPNGAVEALARRISECQERTFSLRNTLARTERRLT